MISLIDTIDALFFLNLNVAALPLTKSVILLILELKLTNWPC